MLLIRQPKLNWVEPHVPARRWDTPAPDVESMDDMNLLEVWAFVRAQVIRRWYDSPFLDDMLSIVNEEFVQDVDKFAEWCRTEGVKPNQQLFTDWVQRSVRWATATYQRQHALPASRDAPIDAYGGDLPPAEVVFTQLRVKHDSLYLLRSIVPQMVAVLHRTDEVGLALVTWEELSVTAAAELMGVRMKALSARLVRASARVLQLALNETADTFTPVVPARRLKANAMPDLNEYIDERYALTVDTWLDRVRTDYMQDPSYLVEIIDRAHGKSKARGHYGNTYSSSLTEEQQQEIRTRRAAGETRASVAQAMGISTGKIEAADRRALKERLQG